MTDNTTFRSALVQLCSGREIARNMSLATQQLREAAAIGANYILTPENTALMELDQARLFEHVAREEDHRPLQALRELADELSVWLHIGSLGVKIAPDKIANRSYLLDPSGKIAAFYDKIHMFDVDLAGGESYRESDAFAPGGRAVLAPLPWGKVGMSICYDLRFPQLYRSLAQAGADFLTVPAAFTRQTGEAHWHVLLRARHRDGLLYICRRARGKARNRSRNIWS